MIVSRSSKKDRTEQLREYRGSHREEIRAQQSQYREKNRKMLRAKQRRHYDPAANALYKKQQAEAKVKKAAARERRRLVGLAKEEFYRHYRKQYLAMQRWFGELHAKPTDHEQLPEPKRCRRGHLCQVWPCIECKIAKQDGLNYPEIPDSCYLTRTPVKAMAGGKHDANRPVFERS